MIAKALPQLTQLESLLSLPSHQLLSLPNTCKKIDGNSDDGAWLDKRDERAKTKDGYPYLPSPLALSEVIDDRSMRGGKVAERCSRTQYEYCTAVPV